MLSNYGPYETLFRTLLPLYEEPSYSLEDGHAQLIGKSGKIYLGDSAVNFYGTIPEIDPKYPADYQLFYSRSGASMGDLWRYYYIVYQDPRPSLKHIRFSEFIPRLHFVREIRAAALVEFLVPSPVFIERKQHPMRCASLTDSTHAAIIETYNDHPWEEHSGTQNLPTRPGISRGPGVSTGSGSREVAPDEPQLSQR